MLEAQWSEEQINQLRTLFAKDFSYDAIARDVGVTKNALIGKLHRLGLHRDAVMSRTKTRSSAEVPRKIDGKGCLFIAGDPKVVWKGHDPFCNAARVTGSPYCEEHHHICYRPLPEKLKRLERLIG